MRNPMTARRMTRPTGPVTMPPQRLRVPASLCGSASGPADSGASGSCPNEGGSAPRASPQFGQTEAPDSADV
jgi:hypothetical protein